MCSDGTAQGRRDCFLAKKIGLSERKNRGDMPDDPDIPPSDLMENRLKIEQKWIEFD